MKRSSKKWWAILILESLFFLALFYSPVRAERGLLGLGTRTLGGRFIWSDEVIYHNWRIQKNAVVGHYHLIGPDDRREAFGSYEHCFEELERIKAEKKLPLMPKDVVIVVHGLGASRQWMDSLSEYIEKEGKLSVVNVGYPSTMKDIGEHSASLASVIKHLDGVESVSFVAHSMGNIVIRHCLNDLAMLPASEQPQITYNRFVMIAPPNHGASAADKFANNKIAQTLGGEAVNQLAPGRGWQSLEQRLATPDFEFGIIVGGRGDDEGYLSAIPGDDDMLLSVNTSKLAGAADFAQVKGIHQTLPKNEQVQEYTLRFLQKGYLVSPRSKRPIVASTKP